MPWVERPWASLCSQCALLCLRLTPQEHGSLNILFKKNKICNLVLVDELQAGLADGDIYLSVYLKEVWLKIFSLDLFIYCVCVCVCGEGEPTSPAGTALLTPPCLFKGLVGPFLLQEK